MNEIMQEFINWLQLASPAIWEALYRQVYIEAVSLFVWSVAVGGIATRLFWLASDDTADDFVDNAVPYFTAVLVIGLTSLGLMLASIARFANPEFYAIRFVLSSLGGG